MGVMDTTSLVLQTAVIQARMDATCGKESVGTMLRSVTETLHLDTFCRPGYQLDLPLPDDVLCGKVKECKSHSGSLRCRNVIKGYIGPYSQAITRRNKMVIVKKIVLLLLLEGRRFLAPCNERVGSSSSSASSASRWEVMDTPKIIDKIGHAIRFAVKQLEQTNQQQQKRKKMVLPSPTSYQSENIDGSSSSEASSSTVTWTLYSNPTSRVDMSGEEQATTTTPNDLLSQFLFPQTQH